jgi:hypothetical protein
LVKLGGETVSGVPRGVIKADTIPLRGHTKARVYSNRETTATSKTTEGKTKTKIKNKLNNNKQNQVK